MAGGKSKTSYAYAIIGVSLVLFLLGTLGWIMINGRGLSRVFKEDIEVTVDFHDNTRDAHVQRLKEILDAQPFTRKTEIISKEDAIRLQSALEGEDIESFLGYNPLFPSLLLKLHSEYVNRDSLDKISKFLMQSNVVREVSYPTTIVDQMNSNFRKISLILGAISLLLCVVVIVLIDNTVRLAMFSNRFLIKTMQMVGATHGFISRPFDRRAILNGLISGLLAVAGLWLVITFAESRLPELKLLQEPLLLVGLMAGMILLGILISFISTHRSVLKYLKMHVEDLY
jgi:cell division transport system permease protein